MTTRHRLLAWTILFWSAVQIPSSAEMWSSQFVDMHDRSWAGPEIWCDQLACWRIRDGRLECEAEGSDGLMRTAQLLTALATEKREEISMSLQLGVLPAQVERDAEQTSDDSNKHIARERNSKKGGAGFVMGFNQGRPAGDIRGATFPGPGEKLLIAVVDDAGHCQLFESQNSHSSGSNSQKSDPPRPEKFRLLSPTSRRGGGFQQESEPLELLLHARPSGSGGYSLRFVATSLGNNRVLSEIEVEEVDDAFLTGGVGLVALNNDPDSNSSYWFENWQVHGDGISLQRERAFGPVAACLYTQSRNAINLTAQFMPRSVNDSNQARLQIEREGEWVEAAEADINDNTYVAQFRLQNWNANADTRYRITYNTVSKSGVEQGYHYVGTIRAEPREKRDFVIAAISGRLNRLALLDFPDRGSDISTHYLKQQVEKQSPDLLFFTGATTSTHASVGSKGLTDVVEKEADAVRMAYFDRWYSWCRQFGELTRAYPTVLVPGGSESAGTPRDDSGSESERAQDRRAASAELITLQYQTQTSHLPEGLIPSSANGAVQPFTTRVEYAGVSFAVLADRHFKAPTSLVLNTKGNIRDVAGNREFDPAWDADVAEAKLLGREQLDFLREWAVDWSEQAWMKVVLSGSVFADMHSTAGEADDAKQGLRLVHALTSNGWPQTGRNLALRAMRRGFALHLAGDCQFGCVLQYGVEQWGDASHVFCPPPLAGHTTGRWAPRKPGRNRTANQPPYLGDFLDILGNLLAVKAASPVLDAGPAGESQGLARPAFGVARLERGSRKITLESIPLYQSEVAPTEEAKAGWPVTIAQQANYGREVAGYLPTIRVQGRVNPVIRVVNENNGETIYALRIRGTRFRPPVFDSDAEYMVEVGDDGSGWLNRSGLRVTPSKDKDETVFVIFPKARE